VVTRRQFVSAAFWASLGQYITIVLSMASAVILSRLLRPQDFGLFGFVLSWLEISFLVSSWGFQSSLVVYPTREPDFLDTVFWLHCGSLGIGIVTSSIAVVWMLVTHRVMEARILALVSAGGFIQSVSYFFSAVLERDLSFRTLTWINTLSTVLAGAAGIFLAYAGWGVWSLVWGSFLGQVLPMVFLLLQTSYRPSFRFNRAHAKNVISFGGLMFLLRCTDLLSGRMDRILVGSRISYAALGFYSKAISTADWPGRFTSATFTTVALPLYSRLQDEPERFGRAFTLLNALLVRLMVLMALPAFVLAVPLFLTLYGGQWGTAGPIFRLIVGYLMLTP